MTPEAAWEASKDQLRMEMSKASYETWVASAEFVDFSDQIFTLGTHNSYGRDWLESRLTSTISRLLSGMVGVAVQVRFAVLEGESGTDPESRIDEEIPAFPNLDEFDIQEVVNSVTSIITQPDRVVMVPKYLLRWLPVVGPDIFWMVIAFRQARFLNTIGPDRKKTFTVRAEEIYRWCGMSRATFWRNIDRTELGWFIERLPQTGWGVDAETGRAKQNPNRYRIQVDIPLTPMDADALRVFLQQNNYLENPTAALSAALMAPIQEILSFPPPRPSKDHIVLSPCPQTVEELILKMLPSHPSGNEIPREISEMSVKLAEKLLRPLENFQLSWYFLQEWLPKLGSGPAALVALLRSLGYYNPVSGELRDEIWINGGYEELAQILGIERIKTLVEWLPSAVNHGKQKDGLTPKAERERDRIDALRKNLAKFIQRVDFKPGKTGYAYKFKIKLDAEPLIEMDDQIVEVVTKILEQSRQQVILPILMEWLCSSNYQEIVQKVEKEPGSGFETLKINGAPDSRLSDGRNSGYETLNSIISSGFETLSKSGVPVLRLFKVLNGLRTLKPLLDIPTSTGEANENSEGVAWQLADLLAINHVSQKKRDALQAQETSGFPFVSWLLYAASSRGAGIKDPISVTISKLLESPGEGAGGPYDRLAQLMDQQLCDLVWDELHFRRPSKNDWREVMENTSRGQLKRLAGELGLELPVDDTSH